MAKVQIIKYGCCGEIFAACTEPECYQDADWQKEMRKYIKQGHTVETIDRNDFRFGNCKCNEVPSLFDENPNLSGEKP